MWECGREAKPKKVLEMAKRVRMGPLTVSDRRMPLSNSLCPGFPFLPSTLFVTRVVFYGVL